MTDNKKELDEDIEEHRSEEEEKSKLKEENSKLKEENSKLKKEVQFMNKIFSENSNECVFNLYRVKKGGEDVWVSKINTRLDELTTFDKCETVEWLISIANPRPSKWYD